MALARKGNQLAVRIRWNAPLTYLRMEITAGTQSRFAVSQDGTNWQPITLNLSEETARSLVRWDRISRPGLYQEGTEEAHFGYARMY